MAAIYTGAGSYSIVGTPGIPAGVVNNHMLLLQVGWKYPASTEPLVPAGWNLVPGSFLTGGAGAAGADTGTVGQKTFWRIADGGEASTTVTLAWTAGSPNCSVSIVQYYTCGAGKLWDIPLATGGADSSQDTTWSVTGAANIFLQSGDHVAIHSTWNTDTGSTTPRSLVATGATIGAATLRNNVTDTTGDDIGARTYTVNVTANVSTAAPVWTDTLSANGAGVSAIVRLRETPVILVAGASAVGTTSVAPGYPAGLVRGDVMLLAVGGKYPTNYPTLPTGWTLIGVTRCHSSTAAGVDDGDVYVWSAYKISDGTESGTLSVTITSGNTSIGIIGKISVKDGYVPSITMVDGVQDTEQSTATTINMSGDPGVIAGDIVINLNAGNTDSGAYASSGAGLAVIGTTLTTAVELWDVPTSQGDDCKMQMMFKDCTVGPSSGIASTIFTVGGALTSTAAQVIRFRQVLSSPHTRGGPMWQGFAAGLWSGRN